MFKTVRIYACVGLVLFVLGALPLLAQSEKMEKKEKSGKGQTITGCVQKGDEEGGTTLKADDGTTYELTSDSVKVADHVGHKVTLTGHKMKASKSDEKMKEASEKKEAGSGKYTDFKVTDLKMVSDSCQ